MSKQFYTLNFWPNMHCIAGLDHHVINLVRHNSYTCVLNLVLSAATVSRLLYIALADTI